MPRFQFQHPSLGPVFCAHVPATEPPPHHAAGVTAFGKADRVTHWHDAHAVPVRALPPVHQSLWPCLVQLTRHAQSNPTHARTPTQTSSASRRKTSSSSTFVHAIDALDCRPSWWRRTGALEAVNVLCRQLGNDVHSRGVQPPRPYLFAVFSLRSPLPLPTRHHPHMARINGAHAHTHMTTRTHTNR